MLPSGSTVGVPETNLVPLSEVDPDSMDEIFQEEIDYWRDQLMWDYQSAVLLIKKYIALGGLSGWALCDDSGDYIGYAYYVINQPVAYIGNIFVRSDKASEETYRKLAGEILDCLGGNQQVRRVESQIFTFNYDLASFFGQRGFSILRRHFLTLPTGAPQGKTPTLKRAGSFRLQRWEKKYFSQAAAIIHDGYLGSPDYELCHDYQSPEGCHRLLQNLVENPGCGVFSPQTSSVVVDRTGHACAVMITSRISPTTGMIPQISVKREFQGRGMGSLLLKTYFDRARRAGLQNVVLSVSEANHSACRLYSRLGFQKTRGFYAFIIDSQRSPRFSEFRSSRSIPRPHRLP